MNNLDKQACKDGFKKALNIWFGKVFLVSPLSIFWVYIVWRFYDWLFGTV